MAAKPAHSSGRGKKPARNNGNSSTGNLHPANGNQGTNLHRTDAAWNSFYNQPDSFADYVNAPHIKLFLGKIIQYWSGGKILEVGIGTGYMSIWLSQMSPEIEVVAMDRNEELVRRAKYLNGSHKGRASFITADAFSLARAFAGENFDVVFHQGLFEHFSDENLLNLLEQQIETAKYVIFSVPSKFYPQQDFGDERLLELEEWLAILSPFQERILEYNYYGHSQDGGGNEELYIVLAGRHAPEQDRNLRANREISEPGPVTVSPVRQHEIFWRSVVFHPSGYAQHARTMLLGMDECGVRVSIDPMTKYPEGDFDTGTWRRLIAMVDRKPAAHAPLLFLHPPIGHKGEDFYAQTRQMYPGMNRYIGSAFFETDRIPANWVPSVNSMDEIWVQSAFNYETFANSGVDRSKLHIIPGGINPAPFNPDSPEKVTFPGNKSFYFLSIFEWTKRKGWDILLKAFAQEFDYREDAGLVLFAYRGSGTNNKDKEKISAKAGRYMMQDLGIDPAHMNNVYVMESLMPNSVMPTLYRAADAFVLPSRGEGWGIPYMEAMTMGLPVIGTRWGANLTFMNDTNSYLIAINGLEPVDEEQVADNPYYSGHNWARPSLDSTKELMRRVFENRKEAKEKGMQARQDILNNWTHRHAGRRALERLIEIEEEDNRKGKSKHILRPHSKEIQVVWNAPLMDPSGYAEDARNLVLGLAQCSEVNIKVNELRWNNRLAQIETHKTQTLRELIEKPYESPEIFIWDIFPQFFEKIEHKGINIGRTTFETDRISSDWASACNAMDEIWVHSEFNVQSFTRSGVDPGKLFRIPESIDADLYSPSVAPLYIPGRAGYNFLSVFDWSLRKGWDILIRAFIEEFSKTEDVALIIKTYSSLGLSTGDIAAKLKRYLTEELHVRLDDAPSILLIDRSLTEREMPQLYRTADAYAMPSRCEGWGRPYMEAMAMGLPVIGTRWSGNLDFMNDDNSYLLDCSVEKVPEAGWKEISPYKGHSWAEPSVNHLRKTMRLLFTNREAGRRKGDIARKEIIETYNWHAVSRIILDRLNEIMRHDPGRRKTEPKTAFQPKPAEAPENGNGAHVRRTSKPVRLKWEGSQLINHSLALVNREICLRLAGAHECDLSLIPYENEQPGLFHDGQRKQSLTSLYGRKLSEPAEVHIRHQWPPKFEIPESGKWVLMQPWEFGYLPRDWILPVRDAVDEIWAYSEAVKKCYTDSGIPGEKVQVIPLGVDPIRFNPHAVPLHLATKKSFKFLYVGGTIWRKGIDILLDAYTEQFAADDDVCLVIKDMGGDTFYRGMNASAKIRDLQSRPSAPEILYIDQTFAEEEMPGLYTACDSLVHPYRGEGFGLPVAEAMACGIPVIITDGGSTNDFAPAEMVYRIRSEKMPVNIEFPLSGQGWVLNPDTSHLRGLLEHVFSNREERTLRAAKASDHIRHNFTWDHTVQKIIGRLMKLREASPRIKQDCEPGSAAYVAGGTEKDNPAAGFSAPERADEAAEEAVKTGDAKFGTGDYGAAIEQYRKANISDPGNFNTAVKLAESYVRVGNGDMAENVLRNMAGHNTDTPDGCNYLGCFLVLREKHEEAIEFFRKALRIAPSDANTMKNLAELYFQTGNFKAAAELAVKILELSGEQSDIRLLLGNCRAFRGEYDEALREYEHILRYEPSNIDAQQNIGIVQKTIKNNAETAGAESMQTDASPGQ